MRIFCNVCKYIRKDICNNEALNGGDYFCNLDNSRLYNVHRTIECNNFERIKINKLIEHILEMYKDIKLSDSEMGIDKEIIWQLRMMNDEQIKQIINN